MGDHQETYDFWLIASNLNQTLATILGVLANALLLYMIRFVHLGEMKVLIPLLNVHSIVGIAQTILNALACARIFLIKGNFFVVLTGSFLVEDPWLSIFLTSIVWIALFELSLSMINNFYRYLLVVKEFQPTTFFVALLAFAGLLVSFAVGVVYMIVVSKIGPSDQSFQESTLLNKSLGFWSNSSMPFLVGKPSETDFFVFMVVISAIFIVSCIVVAFLAYKIHKTMVERRAKHGGRQANAFKNNRTMNNFVICVIAVPLTIYCIVLISSWFLTIMNFDAPHLGLLIGAPLVWSPSLKAIAIILVLPQWRRGFRYCWKRWNSSTDTVHSFRPRQANKSMAERSEVSRNDSKVMY
ncbi:hypothetical protein M3Y97_00198400 [Aphelenchoides bicaudatus]|nr:hypothetical protein M3Y97_00198400 [Aphelenchoides bicaudatus]